MRFVNFWDAAERIRGKRVVVVGGAPSVLDNAPGYIDSHDLVVRVSDYKTSERAGFRTDVHYSFYGTSIRKTAEALRADGVKLCLCKCPNSKPLRSDWHERMGKLHGIDYRYIYKNRAAWWFCDTFIPDDERYLAKFRMLDSHIPTTGFAAIVDVLDCEPKSVYLTGFDFFQSGLRNVDEKWRPGDPNDPICHDPKKEAKALVGLAKKHLLALDKRLARILASA